MEGRRGSVLILFFWWREKIINMSWSQLIICSEQTEMSVSKSSRHLVPSKGKAGWEKYTEFRQQHKCSGDQQVGPFSQYSTLGIQWPCLQGRLARGMYQRVTNVPKTGFFFFFNKETKQSWTTGSEAHVGAKRPEIAQSNKGIHRLRWIEERGLPAMP